MEPVNTIDGKAYPFGLKNIDTDVIIPAEWLKTISRTGLGKGAFEALRKDPDNLFDSPEYAGSPILIAGDRIDGYQLVDGALEDIAPTIGALTGLVLPPTMTGRSLLVQA